MTKLAELSTFGALKISGLDAKKLLQGQITRDLEKITANSTGMAALCNPQGRIISLFYIGQLDKAYYLVMPRSMVTITQTALKKFAVFYKVALSDASSELTILGLVGHIESDPSCLSIALPASNRRILVATPSDLDTLKQNYTSTMTEENWQEMNLAEEIPMIYPQTSSQLLPHEINLPLLHAIDFDKGCYTGQEIIARMQYRGKLKTHLYKASIQSTTSVQPGMGVCKMQANQIVDCGMVIDTNHTKNSQHVLIVTDNESAQQTLFVAQDEHATIILHTPKQ